MPIDGLFDDTDYKTMGDEVPPPRRTWRTTVATDGKESLIFSLPHTSILPYKNGRQAATKEKDISRPRAAVAPILTETTPTSTTKETNTTTSQTSRPPTERQQQRTVAERVREMGIQSTIIDDFCRRTERFSATARLRQVHAARRLALAPLLAVPEAKRQEIIMTQGWMPSTQATQWAILCALARDLGRPMSPLARAIQKRLDALASQRPAWTTDAKDFASPEWIHALLPSAADPYVLAALLTWTLGARIGDILRLRSENVGLYQRFPGTVVHSFTVVEGKTVPHIGPYTVFLTTSTPFNEELVTHTRTTAMARPYLFLRAPTLLTRDALEKAVAEAERELKAKIGNVDLRSLRRGGLSHLSASGFPDEAVRTLSNHTSDAQLQLYLRAGRFNGARAQQQEEMTRAQFENPTPPN